MSTTEPNPIFTKPPGEVEKAKVLLVKRSLFDEIKQHYHNEWANLVCKYMDDIAPRKEEQSREEYAAQVKTWVSEQLLNKLGINLNDPKSEDELSVEEMLVLLTRLGHQVQIEVVPIE